MSDKKIEKPLTIEEAIKLLGAKKVKGYEGVAGMMRYMHEKHHKHKKGRKHDHCTSERG